MGPLEQFLRLLVVWVSASELCRFSKLDVLKAYLLRACLKSWDVCVGFEPLTPQREAHVFEFPPGCVMPCWAGVGGSSYVKTMSQPLLPASIWFSSHLPDV